MADNIELFRHRILPTATNLIPTAGDVLSYGWATAITEQTIRHAGFAGSQVVRYNEAVLGNIKYRNAIANCSLPPGVFGTVYPPMIFGMAQLGSAVIYKNFVDRRNFFLTNLTGQKTVAPMFRTFIDSLRVESTTVGGTLVLNVWKFDVVHYSVTPTWSALALNVWKPPYRALGQQFVVPYTATQPDLSYITLHWYALGGDPNYGTNGTIYPTGW